MLCHIFGSSHSASIIFTRMNRLYQIWFVQFDHTLEIIVKNLIDQIIVAIFSIKQVEARLHQI